MLSQTTSKGILMLSNKGMPDLHRRPFTPETLAERWGCSSEKVRQMFHSGDLAGFRLGKLIRIPAIEVERFECEQTQPAQGTSARMSLSGRCTQVANPCAAKSRIVES